MIKLSKEANVPKLDCPLLTHWISFRLVDEHGNGNSYAGLRYILHADQGQRHEGNLDDEGFARIANCHPGPVILDFSAKDAGDLDSWYDRLINRKSFKRSEEHTSELQSR